MTLAEAATYLFVSRPHIQKLLAIGAIAEVLPKNPSGQINIDIMSVQAYRQKQDAAMQAYQESKGGDDGLPDRRKSFPSPHEPGEQTMRENSLDLSIALQKLHELSLQDGDLGSQYWHEVSQLLRRAASMQAEIDLLGRQLERCRARLAQHGE
ncbi:hypothetical protein [Paraburkholderia tropica]|uniref:hypothetical protein n=1 Tax=Paraburkholderia tropica TaxID=92647 RepID=UPI002ABE1971|nr:hypothetical protein [Paraburkholderia tropica]